MAHDRSGLPRFVSKVAALGLIVLSAGCSAPKEGMHRVDHPESPIESLGFAVYAPATGDWSVAKDGIADQTQIYFVKDFDVARPAGTIGTTTYIRVNIEHTTTENFVRMFGNQHAALQRLSEAAAKPSTGRFTDLSSETTWGRFKGQECVRVARRIEERENPADPSVVLTVESRSTWLFHPIQSTSVIWVTVYQRAPQGTEMPAITELDESFLSKLKFE